MWYRVNTAARAAPAAIARSLVGGNSMRIVERGKGMLGVVHVTVFFQVQMFNFVFQIWKQYGTHCSGTSVDAILSTI